MCKKKKKSSSLVHPRGLRWKEIYRHFYFSNIFQEISSQTLMQTWTYRETSILELTICRASRVYLLRGIECSALMYEFCIYVCTWVGRGVETDMQGLDKWCSNDSSARKSWLWFWGLCEVISVWNKTNNLYITPQLNCGWKCHKMLVAPIEPDVWAQRLLMSLIKHFKQRA